MNKIKRMCALDVVVNRQDTFGLRTIEHDLNIDPYLVLVKTSGDIPKWFVWNLHNVEIPNQDLTQFEIHSVTDKNINVFLGYFFNQDLFRLTFYVFHPDAKEDLESGKTISSEVMYDRKDAITILRRNLSDLHSIVHDKKKPMGNRLQEISNTLSYLLEGKDPEALAPPIPGHDDEADGKRQWRQLIINYPCMKNPDQPIRVEVLYDNGEVRDVYFAGTVGGRPIWQSVKDANGYSPVDIADNARMIAWRDIETEEES